MLDRYPNMAPHDKNDVWAELAAEVRDARRRTRALVADLADLFGPRLDIVNPLHWEIGHVAWFQERWVLRHALGEAPLRADGDALYDSATVPHDARWDLPLPDRAATLAYLAEIEDRVVDRLGRSRPDDALVYFARLSVLHEDMHDEAFTYTRQTLGYPAPPHLVAPAAGGGALAGDARVPGGRFVLGAAPDDGFVFDNEKWGHPAVVTPFAIARAPVTQRELVAFVEDGGYRRRELWTEPGWAWRESVAAELPATWRRGPSGWERREFDRWLALEPDRPVLHVNAFEAEAYASWAGRRLPTELEWEVAAAGEPDASGRGLAPRKRRYPWGDAPIGPTRAHLGGRATGCVDVGAFPEGDSAFGCRQMLGNVWEWTASKFVPYPGFVVDPYQEYSAPWFHTHRVLRGGCFVTQPRLIRNTWRNFYPPDRRDVWAGFRTCAID